MNTVHYVKTFFDSAEICSLDDPCRIVGNWEVDFWVARNPITTQALLGDVAFVLWKASLVGPSCVYAKQLVCGEIRSGPLGPANRPSGVSVGEGLTQGYWRRLGDVRGRDSSPIWSSFAFAFSPRGMVSGDAG